MVVLSWEMVECYDTLVMACPLDHETYLSTSEKEQRVQHQARSGGTCGLVAPI